MDNRLNEAPCGFISLNDNWEIMAVNETLCKWVDKTKEEIEKQPFETLFIIDNRATLSYFYLKIQQQGEIEEVNLHLQEADGFKFVTMSSKRLELDGQVLFDCYILPTNAQNEGLKLKEAWKLSQSAYLQLDHALLQLQQLHDEIEKRQMELMKTNAHLLVISNTDNLTGIANRRYFLDKLDEFIAHFNTTKQSFSLLLIDIDFFKKVNDIYGHHAGDIVLKVFARVLEKHVREQDIVARYGGEEFGVLLAHTNTEESINIALEINQMVSEALWPEIGALTISIGAATYNTDMKVERFIQSADQSLYVSKNSGRNCVTHYEKIGQ